MVSLSEAEARRIILSASKIHPFDCPGVKSGEPHLDEWGRPLQLSVKRAPGGGLEFRVRSAGRDGESGTADDIVSPWGEGATVSK